MTALRAGVLTRALKHLSAHRPLGLLLIALLLCGGCGGGNAGGDLPHFNKPDQPGGQPGAPSPASGPTGQTDPDDAALSHTQRLLAAIPLESPGFPAPISGELPAGDFHDGLTSANGGACRYWLDDENQQLMLAFVFDLGTADEALARLAHLRPNGGEDIDLGEGAWFGQDSGIGDTPAFELAGYAEGQYLVLAGAAITAQTAALPTREAVLSLARQLSAGLASVPVHGASGLSAPAVSPGGSVFQKQLDRTRVTSLTYLKQVTVPLKRGSEGNGSISFNLEITPTDIKCGQWETQQPGVPSSTADSCDPSGPPSTCHIVKVFLAGISLSDYDGDGPGRGSGDLMAGGEISVCFKRGIKTSKQTLSFATGELGDCDANSSLSAGSDPDKLPKFLKTLEACGPPSAIDFDVLVRDNDDGADVVDLITVLIVGAAEGGIGKSTGEAAAGAIQELRKTTPDQTGTPGMQELRKREGDDVGEAHDTQVPLLSD